MTSAKPSRRTYRRNQAEQSALEMEAVRVSLRLFTQGGADAVSMRKLAAEVGVAPMSLYRYFPSKAHLMRHIWQDVLGSASVQGVEECSDVPPGPARLRAFLGGFLQYWLDNPHHYSVVFANHGNGVVEDANAGVLRPDPQDVLDMLGELLDECAGRALPSELRRQMASELFCCAIGFLLATLGLLLTPVEQTVRLKVRVLDGLVWRVQGELAGMATPSTGP
jgi:AcrR family transcriptional regulator